MSSSAQTAPVEGVPKNDAAASFFGNAGEPIDLGVLELQPVEVAIELETPTDNRPLHAGIALSTTRLRP